MMYPEAFNRVPLAFFHCQDPSFSLDYCPALAMVQDGERQWHESKLVCAFRWWCCCITDSTHILWNPQFWTCIGIHFNSWLQYFHGFCITWSFRSSFSVGFYVRLGLETVTIERQRIQASLRNAPSGEDAIDHIQNDDPMRS